MNRHAATLSALLALLLTVGAVAAQRDAGSKIKGNAWSGGYASRTYTRHARDNARVLYHYGRNYEAVPRELAQEHVAAIRSNVKSSGKEVAKAKKQFAQDKDVQKLADQIEKHHAKVVMLCDMLDKEIASDKGDTVKLCECCVGIAKELDAADKAHTELMDKLEMKPLEELH